MKNTKLATKQKKEKYFKFLIWSIVFHFLASIFLLMFVVPGCYNMFEGHTNLPLRTVNLLIITKFFQRNTIGILLAATIVVVIIWRNINILVVKLNQNVNLNVAVVMSIITVILFYWFVISAIFFPMKQI